MYDDPRDFLEDAEKYYSCTENDRDLAWGIYACAKDGTQVGITIIGRLAGVDENKKPVPSTEQYPSIDEDMKKNLLGMDEHCGQHGSVLNSSDWSILMNDAWLLGGIHAELSKERGYRGKTEFHFASPLSLNNLWNEKWKSITVTCREAILLIGSGYKFIRPTKLEAVGICDSKSRANNASLKTFYEILNNYRSKTKPIKGLKPQGNCANEWEIYVFKENKIKEFHKKLPEEVTHYP